MIRSLTRIQEHVTPSMFRTMMNWYPPLIGAGVRVKSVSDNFCHARVEMPLTWYNRNYVGTHFGGSLYSMCDPWYMLLLLNILGKEFIVWDIAAKIQYKKPGMGTVSADFRIEDTLLEDLRGLAPTEKKVFDMPVSVIDENGEIVAEVTKTIYVKRKDRSGVQ